jgi:tight adherence protein C
MTAVVVCAVGSALGILGLVAALRPSPASLRAALAVLERGPSPIAGKSDRPGRPGFRIDRTMGDHMAVAVADRSYVRDRVAPLLRITGMSLEDLCGEVVLAGTAGFLLPGIWWMVVTAGGVQLPFIIPLWASLTLGCGAAALPVFVLHSKATQARRSARRVVGSFLNLVVLCLAGGMGIESALHSSARIGEDAISERILSALVLAQDGGGTPWEALDHLGRDIGVSELTELAAAVGLAGTEGARIRQTLAAKATSIRRHDLSEAEAQANTVTERLFLPGVFLLIGFLLFIAYPAVARISAGL